MKEERKSNGRLLILIVIVVILIGLVLYSIARKEIGENQTLIETVSNVDPVQDISTP